MRKETMSQLGVISLKTVAIIVAFLLILGGMIALFFFVIEAGPGCGTVCEQLVEIERSGFDESWMLEEGFTIPNEDVFVSFKSGLPNDKKVRNLGEWSVSFRSSDLPDDSLSTEDARLKAPQDRIIIRSSLTALRSEIGRILLLSLRDAEGNLENVSFTALQIIDCIQCETGIGS